MLTSHKNVHVLLERLLQEYAFGKTDIDDKQTMHHGAALAAGQLERLPSAVPFPPITELKWYDPLLASTWKQASSTKTTHFGANL